MPCGSWARTSSRVADPGTATDGCPITSTGPNRCFAAATPARAVSRMRGVETDHGAGVAELPARLRCRVDRHRRPGHGRRHGDRHQRQHEELLTPLPAEQPPGPAQHRPAAGTGASLRRRSRRRVGAGSEQRLRSRPAPRSGRPRVRRAGTPPGRPTMRAARRGSPRRRPPPRQIVRSSRITASLLTESSAPVGSSASSSRRSPTTARAIATRWRSPPERSSG